jgi:hypothetical protein
MIKFLYDLFVRDWPLKLFSLALATLTWFDVSFSIRKDVVPVPNLQSTGKRVFFDLPVIVTSSTADVQRFRVKPAEVDVTVQGDSRTLQSLQGSQIRVFVDLTGIDSDTTNSPRTLQVCTPPGVTYTRTSPERVAVMLPARSATNVVQPPTSP